MNVVTESELRELWQNGRGKVPVFAHGTRFSAAAHDFIKANHLEIQLAQTAQETTLDTASGPSESWNKPGVFPVNLSGPIPSCSECGQPLQAKPHHMTQLDAEHFAPKTSPQLIFRGKVDSLHALMMLAASLARKFDLPELSVELDTLAAYCREILSAEYNHRQVAKLSFLGKSEEEIHEISHWPEKYLGIQHLVPGPTDHEILHWLNLLRTQCREAEISALLAFPPGTDSSDYVRARATIHRALNRLSSAVYVLELYFSSGNLSWKVKG